MKLVENKITLSELKEMARGMFGDFVKVVVDVERGVMVVDASLHADEEALLLENGSKQEDLWGINLYPGEFGSDDFVEFDSMINLRPSEGNVSRSVDNKVIRQKIVEVVNKLVNNETS